MRQIELLGHLIAHCPAFQAECGVSTAADAHVAHVHDYEALTAHHTPPYAVPRPQGYTYSKRGPGNFVEESRATLTIEIVRAKPDDDNTGLKEQSREVLALFDEISLEMLARSGLAVDTLHDDDPQPTLISVERLEVLEGPYLDDVAEASLAVENPDVAEQRLVWGITFSVEGF